MTLKIKRAEKPAGKPVPIAAVVTFESKWIKVADKKPESRIRVLAGNALSVEVMYIDFDGYWKTDAGQLLWKEHDLPTHWQPLIKPPTDKD